MGTMQRTRTRMTPEKLNETISLLQDIIDACKACKDEDLYWSKACRKYHLDISKTRDMILERIGNCRQDYVPLKDVEIEEWDPLVFDSTEHFYRMVFGNRRISISMLPYDAEESVYYVLTEAGLKNIELDVLKRMAGIGEYDVPQTMGEIGEEFGKSKSDIECIAGRALRKCRKKKRVDILTYGLTGYRIREKEEEQKRKQEEAKKKAILKKMEEEYIKNEDIGVDLALEKFKNMLKDIPVSELDIKGGSESRLKSAGIINVWQLVEHGSVGELSKIMGIGKIYRKDINDRFQEYMQKHFPNVSVKMLRDMYGTDEVEISP